MPCCKCNGRNARCKGCSCARKESGCSDCYPGRNGRCLNSSATSSASRSRVSAILGLPQSPMATPQPQSPLAALQTSSIAPSSLPSSPFQQSFPSLPMQQLPSTQEQLPSPPQQLPPSSQQVSSQNTRNRQRRKQRCVVVGCTSLIAPSMWRTHMTLHAQGAFPGDIPNTWLEEQDSQICRHCHQIVANSRLSSHSRKCVGEASATAPMLVHDTPIDAAPLNDNSLSLPTFEEVCHLNLPTLRFIPSKSKPAFARALSSALRCVVQDNTEEAWLKLLMLPKCVLPSLRRQGRHDKPLSVDYLDG